MARDDDLAEQARGLRGEIAALVGSVDRLARRAAQSERNAKTLRRFVVGLVLSLALDAALTAYLVTVGHHVRERSACQAAYNEINNERTRILFTVAAQERAAERRAADALYATFLDPSLLKPAAQQTAAERARVRTIFVEFRAAAQALKAERAAADKARAENPVPPSPTSTCG